MAPCDHRMWNGTLAVQGTGSDFTVAVSHGAGGAGSSHEHNGRRKRESFGGGSSGGSGGVVRGLFVFLLRTSHEHDMHMAVFSVYGSRPYGDQGQAKYRIFIA